MTTKADKIVCPCCGTFAVVREGEFVSHGYRMAGIRGCGSYKTTTGCEGSGKSLSEACAFALKKATEAYEKADENVTLCRTDLEEAEACDDKSISPEMQSQWKMTAARKLDRALRIRAMVRLSLDEAKRQADHHNLK